MYRFEYILFSQVIEMEIQRNLLYGENGKDDYGLQQHPGFGINNIATIITHIGVSRVNIILCVDIF